MSRRLSTSVVQAKLDKSLELNLIGAGWLGAEGE